MTSGKEHGREWLEHFNVFLFLMILLNAGANASESLPATTSLITARLQQHPIPPVPPVKNLNTDKIVLDKAIFHDVRLSSNVGGNLFMKIGIFNNFFADRHKQNKADPGRFNIIGTETDRHVSRVPGLRLAALTAAYFHHGSIKTFNEAVKVVAKYQLGRKVTDRDINYIVAFLKTLPDEYKDQPPPARHQLHEPDGAP